MDIFEYLNKRKGITLIEQCEEDREDFKTKFERLKLENDYLKSQNEKLKIIIKRLENNLKAQKEINNE